MEVWCEDDLGFEIFQWFSLCQAWPGSLSCPLIIFITHSIGSGSDGAQTALQESYNKVRTEVVNLLLLCVGLLYVGLFAVFLQVCLLCVFRFVLCVCRYVCSFHAYLVVQTVNPCEQLICMLLCDDCTLKLK